MKKTLLTTILVAILAISTLGAADFELVFGSPTIDQHPEILIGFVPTAAKLGVGYTGLNLIEGNETQLALIAGGGYVQRKVWQKPTNGKVQAYDPIVYDTANVEWELRFSQGFLQSPVEGKDLLTLSASYLGRWDYNKDSMVVGQSRDNGRPYYIRTLDSYLESASYSGDIYPDLRGNAQHLGTAFQLQLKLDMMDEQKMYSNGLLSTFEAKYAPLALNSALDGVADYYSLTLNTVIAYSPYQIIGNDGQHWFSITVVDRINLNWTDGSAVPVYAQGPVSLGRKVRGYNTWTYNTQFTAVNNFDIRFAGPDWYTIFPRVNLFIDAGYGCGDLFNTDYFKSNMLASAGIQVTVSFFDFIDLGYQIAYLFTGSKYTEGPDVNVTGSFTFFLDF